MSNISNLPVIILNKSIKLRWRISLWLNLLKIQNKIESPFNLQILIPIKNTVDPQIGRLSIKGFITIDGERQKYPQIIELISPHLFKSKRQYWLQRYNRFTWLDDCAVIKDDIASKKIIGKQLVTWLQASQSGKRNGYSFNFYATLIGSLHQNWNINCLIERQCQWLRHAEYINQCISHQKESKKWIQLWWNLIKVQSIQIHKLRNDSIKWGTWDLSYSIILENALSKFCLKSSMPLSKKIENKILSSILIKYFRDDGLLFSGNPQQLLRILLVFFDIKSIYEINKVSCPELIISLLHHGAQVIRQLKHGDGALTVFQGGQEEDSILIDKLVNSFAPRIKKINQHSIKRISLGSSTVLMDCISPRISELKCASSLAFEFSDGAHRLVVNCGIPSLSKEIKGERNLYCNTAAHSTVVINNTNSSFIRSDKIKSKKSVNILITPESKILKQVNIIEASHDGYINRYNCGHVRSLQLIKKGHILIGKDCLISKKALEYNLRFHLHPSVTVAINNKGNNAIIKCSAKIVWKFSCRNRFISLEDSVYWGNDSGHKTKCIVISGISNFGETWLNWKWEKYI